MIIKIISIVVALCALAEANSIHGRIVNGQDAAAIVPYHAQLGVRLDDEPERSGSGVIITMRLIITAATNIFRFNRFRAGYASTSRNDLVWATAIAANTIESYNPVTYENNIGFIIFEENAFLNEFVIPIAIPPITQNLNLPLKNEQGRIVGFGWTQNNGTLSNNLQVAFNRVVSDDECSDNYHVDQTTNFCTIDTVSYTKICAGDQGTAFVTNINGQDYLTGIASYILNYECVPGVPALFVRTLAFRSYIDVMVRFWR